MDVDNSPPSPSLADETLRAVDRALAEYLAGPPRPTTLDGALTALAQEARAKAILPERLIVILKDLWFARPEVDAMPSTADQSRLLERVVTMCIKKYYG